MPGEGIGAVVAGPVDHRRRGAFRAQRVALAVGGRELESGARSPIAVGIGGRLSRQRSAAAPSASRRSSGSGSGEVRPSRRRYTRQASPVGSPSTGG